MLDAWDTGELLTSFAERSLVQLAKSRADADQATGGFMLHDLIYDYLRNPQTLRESQTSVRDQHETRLPSEMLRRLGERAERRVFLSAPA